MAPPHGKAHSARWTSRKSAFCTPTVTQSASFRESPPQSALFRRMRLSSPGQTWRRLTEKRILQPAPHGKAHFARWTSRKSAFCADGLTEKRILCRRPHGKAHSPTGASRKSAFSNRRLTEKRSLHVGPHGKAHSARQQSPRVRLFVRVRPRVRFFVECAFPHLRKRGAASRKSAFCADGLTEKRILQPAPHGKAHSATAPRPQRDGKAQSAHNASRKAHSAIPRRPSYVFS